MITVRGLRYVYPKADEPAIDALEFGVERGEIFGFLGPNEPSQPRSCSSGSTSPRTATCPAQRSGAPVPGRAFRLRYGERRVRIEHAGAGGVERSEFPIEGLGDNPEFLGILRQREIETLHTLEATLDDIFVRVTGRRLV